MHLYIVRAISIKGKIAEHIIGWYTTLDRAMEHLKHDMLGFVTTSFPREGVARYEVFYRENGTTGPETVVATPVL